MKEFDLEKAKAGAPLCTRDGDKARIVCYDMKNKDGYHILALIDIDGEEICASYLDNGHAFPDPAEINAHDLMLADVKHEGWVLVDTVSSSLRLKNVYTSKAAAEDVILDIEEDIGSKATNNYRVAHIEWEE